MRVAPVLVFSVSFEQDQDKIGKSISNALPLFIPGYLKAAKEMNLKTAAAIEDTEVGIVQNFADVKRNKTRIDKVRHC